MTEASKRYVHLLLGEHNAQVMLQRTTPEKAPTQRLEKPNDAEGCAKIMRVDISFVDAFCESLERPVIKIT